MFPLYTPWKHHKTKGTNEHFLPPDVHTYISVRIRGSEMFVFRKIRRALFSDEFLTTIIDFLFISIMETGHQTWLSAPNFEIFWIIPNILVLKKL